MRVCVRARVRACVGPTCVYVFMSQKDKPLAEFLAVGLLIAVLSLQLGTSFNWYYFALSL